MNIFKMIWGMITSSRFKSFYWRSAMMFMAGGVSLASEMVVGAGFSAQTTVILGLVLGELSKAMNNYIQAPTQE
jgi:uncharacterized membrane protein